MSNGAANGATTGAAQMNEIMQAGLAKAADLLDKEEFDAAAAAADDVLLGARLSVLSKCALLRGRAILGPLMKRLEDEDQKDPTETEFREAWVMFQLALRFVPENEEAQEGLKVLSAVSYVGVKVPDLNLGRCPVLHDEAPSFGLECHKMEPHCVPL